MERTAHHLELGHRYEKLERRLAKIVLAQTVYGHFFVEQNRLERHGRRWWHPSNHVLNAWSLSLALFIGLTVAFGWGISWLLAVQALVGIVVLEAINYVEHYGLLRRRRANGRFERCAPEHSWNSDRLLTNILLFHIQRHSDHHANPRRRYQTLRSWQSAPQLPAGYPTMIVVAAVPPLFSHVMDPIVVDHYSGDITRANVAPIRRGGQVAHHHRHPTGASAPRDR